MSEQHICSHRWWASRIEVETAPVLHVCVEPRDEHGYTASLRGQPVPVHRCACGAVVLGPVAQPLPPAAAPPP
jgi:hypothetical protein